jgi:hypothetical protein
MLFGYKKVKDETLNSWSGIMAMAVNPVSNLAFIMPVNASVTGNDIDESAAGGFNGMAAFEKILAFRNQQRMEASGKTLPASDRLPVSAEAGLSDTALLNLSPQTLNVLNGVQQPVDIIGATASEGNDAGYDLAPERQLAAILAQFANAPFNENTFIQIQNAITSAGINPDQVSLQGVLGALTPFSLISGEILTNDASERMAA